MVFGHPFCGGPDVISGQVDVFPTERGRMSQQMIRDILHLTQAATARSRYRVFHRMMAVTRRLRPQTPMLLVLIGAVAEPMDEDCPC
jgi:hypothetical protein